MCSLESSKCTVPVAYEFTFSHCTEMSEPVLVQWVQVILDINEITTEDWIFFFIKECKWEQKTWIFWTFGVGAFVGSAYFEVVYGTW